MKRPRILHITHDKEAGVVDVAITTGHPLNPPMVIASADCHEALKCFGSETPYAAGDVEVVAFAESQARRDAAIWLRDAAIEVFPR